METKPSVADKDIKVYKVLIVKDNTLRTGTLGREISTIPVLLKPSFTEEKPFTYKDGLTTIYEGYIHSCKTLEDAKSYIKTCRVKPWQPRIIESYIPKGTEYYNGINGDMCSKQLFLRKIMTFDDIRYTNKRYIPLTKLTIKGIEFEVEVEII